VWRTREAHHVEQALDHGVPRQQHHHGAGQHDDTDGRMERQRDVGLRSRPCPLGCQSARLWFPVPLGRRRRGRRVVHDPERVTHRNRHRPGRWADKPNYGDDVRSAARPGLHRESRHGSDSAGHLRPRSLQHPGSLWARSEPGPRLRRLSIRTHLHARGGSP
jgi:hypothetical protein